MNRLLFNGGLAISRPLVAKLPFHLPKPNLIVKDPVNFISKPIACHFSTNYIKPFIQKQSYSSYAPINIDVSNLAKDIIIYKYDNPKYFKIMNVCGIVQFLFWLLCAEFTISNLRDVPVNKDDPNFEQLPFYAKMNLGENKYKTGMAMLWFMVGK